jgi:hypothetical protein
LRRERGSKDIFYNLNLVPPPSPCPLKWIYFTSAPEIMKILNQKREGEEGLTCQHVIKYKGSDMYLEGGGRVKGEGVGGSSHRERGVSGRNEIFYN